MHPDEQVPTYKDPAYVCQVALQMALDTSKGRPDRSVDEVLRDARLYFSFLTNNEDKE